MLTQKTPKTPKKYICISCDFTCSRQTEYDRHILTQKHINANNANIKNTDNINKKNYKCNNCDLILKHLSSLSRHKKKCLLNKTTHISFDDDYDESINENIVVQDASNNDIVQLLIKENSDFKHIIIDLVKSNTDLQKQMIDVCQKIQPASSASSTSTINNNTNNTTTTNSHNKTFNLNFFLNEQCKDAMNINDFVKSIKIEMSDLERLGKEGYVEGISRIILEKLKELDIYKRPLHCSDAKRETMYIKDNDVWNKDESPNNEKMIEFIKAVEQRNYTSLLAYADEYPEVYKQESKRNVPYLHMAMQSNGTAEKINKVMKRIIKEVVINKDN